MKDRSISFVRLVSFSLITSCHFLQYFDNWLAWWLNVGVQVFLFMSGYLYGKREITSDILFYKKQLRKILIPYYVVVVVFIIIELLVCPEVIKESSIIPVLLCAETFPGGEHLWFIPTILMCYLLTPFLQRYLIYTQKHFTLACIGIVFMSWAFFKYFCTFFCKEWMICYIIGYCVGFSEEKNMQTHARKMIIIISVLTLQNLVQLWYEQVMHTTILGNYYVDWYRWNHVWLGSALFFLFRKIYSLLRLEKLAWFQSILDISDKYSYEGYLVHSFFILGPLSLIGRIHSFSLNIAMIFLMIGICAVLVKKLSISIQKRIAKKSVSTPQ